MTRVYRLDKQKPQRITEKRANAVVSIMRVAYSFFGLDEDFDYYAKELLSQLGRITYARNNGFGFAVGNRRETYLYYWPETPGEREDRFSELLAEAIRRRLRDASAKKRR